MKSKLALTLAVTTSVVIVGAIFFGASGRRTTLIANGQIQVVDRAVADPAQVSIIGTIQTGEEVVVTRCVDIKHYIVPEVRMKNGQIGYVVAGDFELIRKAVLPVSDAPIVFSC